MLNFKTLKTGVFLLMLNAVLVGFNLRALLITTNWNGFTFSICLFAVIVNIFACYSMIKHIKSNIETQFRLNSIYEEMDHENDIQRDSIIERINHSNTRALISQFRVDTEPASPKIDAQTGSPCMEIPEKKEDPSTNFPF
jgi:predicted membrane protein